MLIKDSQSMDNEGFWSPVTSTVEWCEENYAVSPFIAEYWNTLTNIIMIIPPLAGAYSGYKIGLEWRYIACFIGVGVVGIGSWLFHMTLRYSMQLMDELPMLWAATFLLYTIIKVKSVHVTHDILMGFMIFFVSLVSLIYIFYHHYLIHNISYGIICFLVVVQGARMIRTMECARHLYLASVFSFVVGFIFWNMDNLLCHYLRGARGILPSFLAPLTQFHAMWHLLAGGGSYMSIIFMIHTRLVYLKRKVEVCNTWYLLPHIRIVSE